MKNFKGYQQLKLPKNDETISQTDPGTPCQVDKKLGY